jgi:hypothetical protein
MAQVPTPGLVASPCPPPDPDADARLAPVIELVMTPAASPEALPGGGYMFVSVQLAAMRTANRPAEAHLLQEGGHAFASGYAGSPTSSWIGTFDAWLGRLRTNRR